jgi:secreted trypsin-like serine protease
MRPALAALALLLCAAPAAAMVGCAAPAADAEGGASAVLIVGSRGNSCTGAAVARDLVLTAAHCVAPGADYKLVEFDAARRPTLKDVREVVRHPQFSLAALSGHRATADVALIKLAAPLPARFVPARLSAQPAPTQPGGGFLVAGFGVTVRGDGKSGGTLRAARLAATGRPGGLQLRLLDPAARGERAGLGACTGDSGAPVFEARDGRLLLIGVVSWSTGPRNAAGCGGLTGVTPLALYRGWIMEAGRKLGSPLE